MLTTPSASGQPRPSYVNTLPLFVSLFALSLLLVVHGGGCGISQPWASPADPQVELLFPALLRGPNSSLPCQVILINQSLLDDDQSAHIVGVDVDSGEQRWSWLLSDGLDGRGWGLPILASPSDHLFSLTLQFGVCGTMSPLYNLTRASYDRRSGLQAEWSSILGCIRDYEQTLVFSASTQPQTGEEQPELLLVMADNWLIVHGQSGQVLHEGSGPADAFEVAILGDSAAHRFIVLEQWSDTEARAVSYQPQDDGKWKKLATASYDSSQYAPVQVSVIGLTYANRGEVMVMQHLAYQDQLYGLDVLTGQQVWSASGYPLLTGAWVASDSNFTAFVAELDPHPVRPDWVLMNVHAINSSGFVINQFGLLDSATGKMLATSAATPPTYYGDGASWYLLWDTVADSSIIVRRLAGSTNGTFWIAMNATTLETVSDGSLPPTDPFSDLVFVDAQPGSVSIVVTAGDGSIAGKIVESADAVQADARGTHLPTRATKRSAPRHPRQRQTVSSLRTLTNRVQAKRTLTE